MHSPNQRLCRLKPTSLEAGTPMDRSQQLHSPPAQFDHERRETDEIISAQQDEIAALRRQLREAGIAAGEKSRPKPEFASTDGHDTQAFYDMDTNRLVRPSELLIGDKVGHNFKHIMSDFSELQRRVLRRVLAAGEKKERVVKYHTKLQTMQQGVEVEANEAHKAARDTLHTLRGELDKMEAALFGYVIHVHTNNTNSIQEQVGFCESLVADIEEGLALAQDFLQEAKEDAETKPISVIQSIEVGLDELQEATVKRRPELTPFGGLNVEPVLRSFQGLSFHPTTDSGAMADAVGRSPGGKSPLLVTGKGTPPAYERLHRIAVRKAIERQTTPVKVEPFSSFPASPPHHSSFSSSAHSALHSSK